MTPGTLLDVPFDLDYWQSIAQAQNASGLPEPYSNDPTQWLFKGRVDDTSEPLQVAVARGKEPPRAKDEYPWFWGWDQKTIDFQGGAVFTGERFNACHYSNAFNEEARKRWVASPGSASQGKEKSRA